MPARTFTVRNTGGTATGRLAVGVNDTSSFTIIGGTCADATLAAGAACTVLVQFAPTGQPGSKPALLSVGAAGVAAPPANLIGIALTAGELVIESLAIDFGAVAIGTQSDEAPIVLHNSGQSRSGPISLQLSDGNNFVVSSNPCAAGLDVGQRCTVGVRFAPKAVGAKDGVSLTASADPGGAAPIALRGTGTVRLDVARAGSGTGKVVSQPDGIDCGANCDASFSDKMVMLQATPDALSALTAWSVDGCTPTDPCVVPSDTSRTVTATFTLVPAILDLVPTKQDFGAIALGATSLPVTLTLSNRGGATTNPIGAKVDDGADYGVVGGSCVGARLGGGKSCTILVVFHPIGSAGPKAATLSVAPAGSTPRTASLSGTALTVAALTVDPQSHVFDPVPIGRAGPEVVFAVTNRGQTASGRLTFVLSDSSNFQIASTDCPASLASQESCHIAVVSTPVSVGLKQGVSLTISGDPGGSVPASLQGTGTASLTVTNAGGGTVASVPDGIQCGAACAATFTDSPVHLLATPDALHDFGGWSLNGCSGTGCDVPLAAATQTIVATFTAKPAKLAIAPTTRSFGSVTIGSASAPVTFTVSNLGGSASGAIAATLDDAADYAVTGGTCPGVTLAVGASCTVNVVFAPAGSAGAKTATLTASASPGGGAPASLSGTALTPATLTIAPTTNNFGSLAIGSASATVSFSVKNTGQSPTGALTAGVTGSGANQFALVGNDCPATLPANGSCTIGVQFKPTSVGAKAATLAVSANPGASAPAALQGTGTAAISVAKVGSGTVTSTPGGISCGSACTASFSVPSVLLHAVADPTFTFTAWDQPGCPGTADCQVTLDAATKNVKATFTAKPAALSVVPTSQDFGSRAIGTQSAPTTFTVSNTGGLPSGAITASVSDASYTVVDGTCLSSTLAAGATCTVNVRYNPVAPAGAKPATLTVSGSPGGAPTSSLTGTALTAAQLALTPSPRDFGSVAVGSTSSALSFTLKNNGQAASGTLSVSLGGANPTSFAIASNDCPTTLAPNATCTIGVRFAPASIAAKAATLTATATPGGTATASLTGTGTVKVTVTVSGGGTVSSVTPPFSCTSTCSQDFAQASITLTATPGATFAFGNWTGACSGSGACALTLSTTAVNVGASFVCPGTTSLCNGVCFDLTSDENNCGSCGNVCVAQTCVDRTCETTVTQVPSPPTTSVLGMWGSGPNDVWGAGSGPNNSPAFVHWNGTAWSSFSAGTTTGCALSGIWGTAANDVWASGSCGGRVTHFDGTSWQQENQNVAPTFPLSAIWASSPNDVWAVGNGGLVMHKIGATWTGSQVPVFANELMESVWGTSSTDVWAGGGHGKIFHWDGNGWTSVPSGLGSNTGTFILSFRGFSASDVWASGSAGTVLHWNGAAWSVVVPEFQVTGAQLDFIGGSSVNDLFIGGFDGALFHKGTGTAWTSLPVPGGQDVRGIWSNGPADTWIGGFSGVILHSP